MSQHATSETTSAGSSTDDSSACEVPAHWQLPTLPRNALRKVFDRPDFTPGEVALLGHRRLERADGIGQKGMATIIEWLRCHGYELADDTFGSQPRDLATSLRQVKRLEKAMRVLQTHGYTVFRGEPSAGDGKDCCSWQEVPSISE